MDKKEMLAALRRIEAVAHYYASIAGTSDELRDALNHVTEEASVVIYALKQEQD